MKKQLVNLLTTLLGLLLIPSGIYTVIYKGITWWDFLGAVVGCLILTYMKDSDGVLELINKLIDRKIK